MKKFRHLMLVGMAGAMLLPNIMYPVIQETINVGTSVLAALIVADVISNKIYKTSPVGLLHLAYKLHMPDFVQNLLEVLGYNEQSRSWLLSENPLHQFECDQRSPLKNYT